MDSPSQMMQAHQQLQSQVMQLSSQQNEIAHQLRAVLDTFPQEHAARPISVLANRPSHCDGLCFYCKHKGLIIRVCLRKKEAEATFLRRTVVSAMCGRMPRNWGRMSWTAKFVVNWFFSSATLRPAVTVISNIELHYWSLNLFTHGVLLPTT